MTIGRRGFLTGMASVALGWPLARRLGATGQVRHGATARRLIVFYFPDGVVGQSQDGSASEWHPTGGEQSFNLPVELEPMASYRNDAVFFRGLSMGPTDAGSHPGGAKKLLTGVDGGNGISLDRYLADSVGAGDPFRHLYLGVMANQNNASGDKHISYLAPGQTTPPDDDPVAAFQKLFGSGGLGGGGGGGGGDTSGLRSILDHAADEVSDLRGRVSGKERQKLELHFEALREVEDRLMGGGGSGGTAEVCSPYLDGAGLGGDALYQAERFPDILAAQTKVMVEAMACGLTRVGVLQCSHHTSDLIMSRFADTAMYDPNFDMRSHQASHYGASHDPANRLYRDYLAQRRWWVARFADLLAELDSRPEGDGTMLDYSLVLLATEVCDGNTHSHDDMPFVVAGGGAGILRTGRLLSFGYRRHGDLLAGLGRAMGAPLDRYGDGGDGVLPGLLA